MIAVIGAIQLVLVGLLAGEELIVRYGVQPALDSLPDSAHVHARIALVKRLKIVVPIMMVPAVIMSVALLIVAGGDLGLGWRIAGMSALVGFLLFSFLGTVPINMKVNDWNPREPPMDWHRVVHRWETIDTFRSSAAILSFVFFTIGAQLV